MQEPSLLPLTTYPRKLLLQLKFACHFYLFPTYLEDLPGKNPTMIFRLVHELLIPMFTAPRNPFYTYCNDSTRQAFRHVLLPPINKLRPTLESIPRILEQFLVPLQDYCIKYGISLHFTQLSRRPQPLAGGQVI